MKKRRLFILLLCLTVVFTLLPAPAFAAEGAKYSAIGQLNGADKKLGIITGMAFEELYEAYTPDAQLCYFNNLADMMYALSIDQIDGFLMDEPMGKYLESHNEGLAALSEVVLPLYDYGFIFGETDFDIRLQTQFNEYLAAIQSDGTLDRLFTDYYENDETLPPVDYPASGSNGTIRVATNTGNPPLSYVKDGAIAGLEMEVLAGFGREYGYAVEVSDMDFSALLTSISSGRSDVAAAYLAITEERLESVRFSDPYTTAGSLMMVRSEVAKAGFWSRLSQSFEKTFVREARWKLIAQGMLTTLIISVFAAILGTLLGFGLCLLRRMDSPVIRAVTGVYIRILQGTPLLVLLMILYYVIFGRSGLDGRIVAIIAFAMNFAAYVCEIMRSGIESIDRGQTEAALAIGFTKAQSFFRIVLPQAAVNFLPVYKGEFISMLKMTSIVGYIAVQDLTKMSDIIRSRTYEAFFPLIATAIIYFALSALLSFLLGRVEIKVRPKRGKKKLKGVNRL